MVTPKKSSPQKKSENGHSKMGQPKMGRQALSPFNRTCCRSDRHVDCILYRHGIFVANWHAEKYCVSTTLLVEASSKRDSFVSYGVGDVGTNQNCSSPHRNVCTRARYTFPIRWNIACVLVPFFYNSGMRCSSLFDAVLYPALRATPKSRVSEKSLPARTPIFS